MLSDASTAVETSTSSSSSLSSIPCLPFDSALDQDETETQEATEEVEEAKDDNEVMESDNIDVKPTLEWLVKLGVDSKFWVSVEWLIDIDPMCRLEWLIESRE